MSSICLSRESFALQVQFSGEYYLEYAIISLYKDFLSQLSDLIREEEVSVESWIFPPGPVGGGNCDPIEDKENDPLSIHQ